MAKKRSGFKAKGSIKTDIIKYVVLVEHTPKVQNIVFETEIKGELDRFTSETHFKDLIIKEETV